LGDVSKRLSDFGDKFLTKVQERAYDTIVPVERKGFALFAIMKKQMRKNESIILDEKIALKETMSDEQIKGKKILVFDDTVSHGWRIKKTAKELLERGASYVETLAFIVNESCPVHLRPSLNIYFLVNEDEYEKSCIEITKILLLEGRPLDIDHLVVNFWIKPEKKEALLEQIKEMGYIFEIESIANRIGIKIITIDQPDFFDLNTIAQPPIAMKEGVSKVRLWIHPDGHIYCVPLTFPYVLCDETFEIDNCVGRNAWGRPFCKIFSKEFQKAYLKSCSHCVRFHTTEELGYQFFKSLRSNGFEFKVFGCTYEYLQLLYADRTNILSNFITGRINSLRAI